jgi:glycerol-3-phosphate dehydrogenase
VKRDIAALTSREFDLLVIGGGIVGACMAWDATQRGLSVALVERHDFGGGTSANSLKTIHGGLRYLQHLDFGRMRESIRERSVWLRIAPHLIHPLPFLVPTYRYGLQRRGLLRAALAANDLAGLRRNAGQLPERRLPAARALSRGECLELVPELASPGLTGAVVYYDAQMYSPERLVLEVATAAWEEGAVVANHAEATRLHVDGGRVQGVELLDRVQQCSIEVRARTVINAAGPDAVPLAERLLGERLGVRYAHSVALNLVVPALGHDVAFALRARSKDVNSRISVGGRQLLLVPWRNRTLLGTGHYPLDGRPLTPASLEGLVSRFLEELNGGWAGDPVGRDAVQLVHSGLLPDDPAAAGVAVQLLRHPRIVDYRQHGIGGMISVEAVKFTTARRVAETAVDQVCSFIGKATAPCRTHCTPLPGAVGVSIGQLLADARSRHRQEIDADTMEHLVRTYGGRYRRVLDTGRKDADWNVQIDAASPAIRAQLRYGVEQEMAQTADDLLLRRTEIGALGSPSAAARLAASEVLAARAAPTPAVPEGA